jgi:cupin 2 domain-containing protein
MNLTNIYSDIPPALPEELVQALVKNASCRIERIVSQSHPSPPGFWYDQQENEWVLLLQGAAKLRFENELVEMKPGDFLIIPAHRKHRVEWTIPDEPTVWLAVFYEQSLPVDA